MKRCGGSLKAYFLTERSYIICEGYTLYDSKYMILWKRQNYGNSERSDEAQRIFRAVNIPWEIL